MSFVYWIKLPEHTDVLSQGYVGVTTKTVDYRWKQHKRCKEIYKHIPIYRALKKYASTIMVQTLLEGSTEYCYLMENILRPVANIAWNVNVGGERGTLGNPCSPETRLKISLANKGRKLTQEQIKSKVESGNLKWSEEKKLVNSKRLADNPWVNPRANHSVWAIADEVFKLKPVLLTQTIVTQSLGLNKTQLNTIWQKLKAGWNPLEDSNWLAFSSQYKLEQEAQVAST